eukprot:COSAG05_NODE_12364_length_471_cov_0.661290_1_plen_70_part_01
MPLDTACRRRALTARVISTRCCPGSLMAGIIRVLMSTSCAAVISCAEVADLVGLLASAAREHHHRVRLVF